MRCRQQADCSSDDSDGSNIESCFDTEDEESDPDTNPTDVDTDVEGDDEADISWLLDEDKDHPPEYYLNQEDEFNESEFMNEDYSDNSTLLLDFIEDRWHRYCQYVGKDPDQTIRVISLRLLNSFFDWVLNQRRGKGGRKLHGVKSSSTLCTYWKVFRLVYEGAAGSKINAKLNRQMHRVLKKLVKKHGLSTQKREKTAMYIEDLVEVLQTNLTTTKKRYSHGRHRMQIALFHHLAGFSANRPQALLNLCYRHIVVTLLRDPEGGPHRILLEFTYEFTKQYLGMKDANTFPIPEVIYDPSLVLSPHIILLGLILADGAFAAPNLTCAEQLSKLDIRPGCNQLPLLLLPEKADIPVFRKSIKTLYGWEISPDQPLPYSTLLPCTKKLGVLTGFPQITRPYCLRYGAGNAFNQSGDVSDALQNLMMQHADMRTFVKHYLPRRVTADTAAIVRGLKPQHTLMRAACRMSRWINPDRPQELTKEQSLSVNQHPRIRRLIAQREKWKRRPQGKATEQPGYRALSREIVNERQRQRCALLKQVQERWDQEHPVNEVELQLSGHKFSKDVKTTLELSDEMPPIQKRLVETIMTRNTAISAVAAYCKFEEGGARPHRKSSTRRASPTLAEEASPQSIAAAVEKQVLSAAMLSVYKEKRPTICFVYLGERTLELNKRVYSFASSGDLSKHFKRKHLSNGKAGQRFECKVCRMSLEHKMHLQNHALKIHRTVS